MRRYDVIVVGGGHNGLAAAAYLGRAGMSVLVLERLDRLGGAAVSEAPFAGVDARLSRYSYLVSLLPDRIVAELGLAFRTRERRISSYTPLPGSDRGVLIDALDRERTRASISGATGEDPAAWERFYARIARAARLLAPTLLEPLRTRDDLRRLVADDDVWDALVERPIGEAIESALDDDVLRGIVLTDALVGTFARADEPSLRQNRTFLYHVIGNGTGAWNVPVGGMGALVSELAACAGRAGAALVSGASVSAIEADGRRAEVRYETAEGPTAAGCDHVVAACAPAVLDRLLGREPEARPEGAQVKVNMLLERLPRLRDPSIAPEDAFAGTLHVNETYSRLAAAHDEATGGRLPSPLPCEVYCHSLTDPSILGAELAERGVHTLTLFGLQTPTRLFDGAGAARDALDAALQSLDSVLAEPIRDCLLRAPDGTPCVEVRTPLDLDDELALPGGNIFHRDLAWPFAEKDADAGRWGTETDIANVQLGGAGARRGGGVSCIAGRNAAIAILGPGPEG
jgi:phytoene dehydrogenase-like protein